MICGFWGTHNLVRETNKKKRFTHPGGSVIPRPANYGSGIAKSIDLSRQVRFYVRISNAKKYRTLIKICEANQNIFAGWI